MSTTVKLTVKIEITGLDPLEIEVFQRDFLGSTTVIYATLNTIINSIVDEIVSNDEIAVLQKYGIL